MSTDARKQLSNDQIIERAVRSELTEAQIKELVAREPELAALAFIAAVQAIGQLRSGAASITPSTPPPVSNRCTPSRSSGRSPARSAAPSRDTRVVADLLILLASWGECGECAPRKCPADLTGSCAVGVPDLLILLANWG